MKIPEKLQLSPNSKIFVIVASNYEIDTYQVNENEIVRQSVTKIDKPHYFNRRDVFEARSRGGVARSGSVLRPIDRATKIAFKQELTKVLAEAKAGKYERIVCFYNKEIKKVVKESVSKRDKTVALIEAGNITHEKPLKLVERMKSAYEEKIVQPISQQVHHLLVQARRKNKQLWLVG